jgi:hypothetical protein
MPVIIEQQGSIGDLIVGPGTPYLIEGWDYLDHPAVFTDDYRLPGQHGRQMAPADVYDGRTMVARLRVFGGVLPNRGTTATVRANLNALSAACAQWGPQPIVQEMNLFAIGDTFPSRFTGRVRGFVVDEETIQFGHVAVAIRFECKSAWREDSNIKTLDIGLPGGGGGRTYDLTFDRVYGAPAVGGSGIATNSGTIPVWPTITINGGPSGVDNPRVTHLGQDKTLRLAGILIPAGDTLTIDTEAGTVLLNGTASRYGFLVEDEWFTIEPGPNTILYNANTALAGSSITVAWRDGYL